MTTTAPSEFTRFNLTTNFSHRIEYRVTWNGKHEAVGYWNNRIVCTKTAGTQDAAIVSAIQGLIEWWGFTQIQSGLTPEAIVYLREHGLIEQVPDDLSRRILYDAPEIERANPDCAACGEEIHERDHLDGIIHEGKPYHIRCEPVTMPQPLAELESAQERIRELENENARMQRRIDEFVVIVEVNTGEIESKRKSIDRLNAVVMNVMMELGIFSGWFTTTYDENEAAIVEAIQAFTRPESAA